MNIDTTKPSIGRIYDYMLGGHHNFEVDRIAAQQILKVLPSYPTWARLNRWFVQFVADQWASSGHNYILDLGSGMPTQGHFHSAAPHAKVLYSDIDPVTVAYAQEVIGDNPLVAYIQADMRDPGVVFEVADKLFQGERRVAIGFIGLSYFLDDQSFSRVVQMLYDWAAPGSVMALSYVDVQTETPEAQAAIEAIKRNATQELYMRNEAQICTLMAPWKVLEIKPLATWLGVEQLVQESDHEQSGAQMYGVMLVHEE
jgi:O-methyltransferase involved in polyketide biosynthesis